jgi:hypothetical protein
MTSPLHTDARADVAREREAIAVSYPDEGGIASAFPAARKRAGRGVREDGDGATP